MVTKKLASKSEYLLILCVVSWMTAMISICSPASLRAAGVQSVEAETAYLVSREKAKGEDMADKDRLTEEEGRYLLSLARKTIEQRILGNEEQVPDDEDLPSSFHERRGTFVTLTIDKALRGCIGHIIPQESLMEGIKVNAINAAFRDPRFRPLSEREWRSVKIEISILTDPKPLAFSSADELLGKLRPGVDGVILKKGFHQATFLPQVWEQLPDKKQFLTHLCMKAGLDGDAWKNEKLEVLTYQVQAFEEH